MQAPETVGRVYGCFHCDTKNMTINESFEHTKKFHPETIKTKTPKA